MRYVVLLRRPVRLPSLLDLAKSSTQALANVNPLIAICSIDPLRFPIDLES